MFLTSAPQVELYNAFRDIIATYRPTDRTKFIGDTFRSHFAMYDTTMSTVDATQKAADQTVFAARVWDDLLG